MKNELTAKRIQLALSNANMKPQELSDITGVSKASISQYVNGSHVPGNISAEKIGKILKVSPLWLMGFDVPIDRAPAPKENYPQKIMQYYDMLNDTGKKEAEKRIEELTHVPKYSLNTKVDNNPNRNKNQHNDSVDELEARYKKMTSNSAQKTDCTVSSTTDGTEVTQEKASNL